MMSPMKAGNTGARRVTQTGIRGKTTGGMSCSLYLNVFTLSANSEAITKTVTFWTRFFILVYSFVSDPGYMIHISVFLLLRAVGSS